MPGQIQFSADEEKAMRQSAAAAREAAASSLPSFKSRPGGMTLTGTNDAGVTTTQDLGVHKIPRAKF
jgi:hypothetical protein